MQLFDLMQLSLRMFRTRKMRTFLTILGVSVGIGAVLTLVSFGYGLQEIILKQITTTESLLSLDIIPGPKGLIALNQSNLDIISKIENVDEISPLVTISSQISIDDLAGDTAIYGINPSYFRLGGVSPKWGGVFQDGDTGSIVISSAILRAFYVQTQDVNENLDEAAKSVLGKEASFVLFVAKESEGGGEFVDVIKKEEKFKIVGVIESDSTSFVYFPLNKLSDINFTEYTTTKVKVKDSVYLEPVRNQIVEMGFLVSALSDTIDQANKIFGAIQITLALFGIIALFVSAIGMFNTMTITLLERTQEIGIMKSIGASSSDILQLFLMESIIIGTLGGFGGIIVGVIAGSLINLGINLLAKGLGGSIVNLFIYPVWFMVFIVVISFLVGFVTGLFPARRASKLNPLKALRYK